MSERIAKRLEDATPRKGSSYPGELGRSVEGRIKWALGNLFGLDQFGVNIAELAPGSGSALRHWHSAEDEFIYVLDGELTLVTDGGEETLVAGDCAGFKAGSENGHMLVNRSGRTARYLEVGSRRLELDRVEYPGVDLLAEPDGAGGRRYTHRDGSPY